MTSIKRVLAAASAVLAFSAAPALANGEGCFNKTTGEYETCPGDEWTGFFLGANVGARYVDPEWTPTSVTSIGGAPLAAPVADFSTVNFDDWAARLGLSAGYDQQISPFVVVGVEAEIGVGGNEEMFEPIPGFQVLDPGGAASDSRVESLWDASLRARAGWLATSDLLIYATGGVAFLEIDAETTCSGASAVCVAVGTTNRTSTEETLTGYTIGGGLEFAVAENVTLKGEYRYADYGEFDVVGPVLSPGASAGATHEVEVTSHTAVVGLNYKF